MRNERLRHAVDRHICIECRSRRSTFRYRGRVRADRHHTLCFQCHRALVNQTRHSFTN